MDEKEPEGAPEKSAADAGAQAAGTPGQIDPMRLERFMRRLRDEQNLTLGIVAGVASAVIGAAAWGFITAATKYQIGYMAVGVGFLVGFAVRKLGNGIDKTFALTGALCALLGCAAGNLLAGCILIADALKVPVTQVIFHMTTEMATLIMKELFSPMDILFYGIAVYEGWTLSTRRITEDELRKLAS